MRLFSKIVTKNLKTTSSRQSHISESPNSPNPLKQKVEIRRVPITLGHLFNWKSPQFTQLPCRGLTTIEPTPDHVSLFVVMWQNLRGRILQVLQWNRYIYIIHHLTGRLMKIMHIIFPQSFINVWRFVCLHQAYSPNLPETGFATCSLLNITKKIGGWSSL